MPAPVPCLWFDGQAEQAARFYVDVFPRSEVTSVSRVRSEGPHGQPVGSALTVAFVLDGQAFTALNGGPHFTFSPATSFTISCADQSEVDHYWERLGEGGEHGPCGWLTDRFGLSWQVVPTRLVELLEDPDDARADRAMQAMLQMTRLDVATLERAADDAG